MSSPGQEFVEVFLQEASEHLQFLREYSTLLQDPYPAPDDIERLYVAAHTLKGSSAMYSFPLFSEISAKLAHIFQYAMNATISPDACAPLVEFISEAVAVLESDLLIISANGVEATEEIAAFKRKYPFAFQTAPVHAPEPQPAAAAIPAPPAEVPAKKKVFPPMPQRHVPVETAVPTSAPERASEAASAPQQSTPLTGPEPAVGPLITDQEEPLLLEDEAIAPVEMFEQLQAMPEPDAEAVTEVPASVKPAAAVEKFDLPPDGEVPAEVMEFFVPECEEHLQAITDCLLALEANPQPDDIHRLFRAMHTIKGSAAQVGLPRISLVAHRAEDLIGRLRDGAIKPGPEIVDICLESVDTLKKFLYRQWSDEDAIAKAVKSLLGRIARLAPEGEEAPAVAAEKPAEPTGEPTPAEESKAAETETHEVPDVLAGLRKEPSAVPQSKSVRIALDRLDRMMNAVGELVINRTRIVGRLAELEHLADILNFSKARMADKITEFQDKYEFSRITGITPVHEARHGNDGGAFGLSGDSAMPGGAEFPFRGGYSSYTHSFDSSLAEFSELEMDRYDEFSILSRSLTEISADVTEILTQLDGFVRRVDGDIDEFTKLAHRLQDEITQARMVPIGNLYTRITRTVRDAAKAANKQVELSLSGAETELDNNIIQQISDPLLHLVRNSVAHGIERSDERYELGKPDHGNIAVRAYHRGNHIYIEVEDDGRGIDYEKVRAAAVQCGLATQDEAEAMDERSLLDLLFHPGFSTAPTKTELAGRGVGLDVVRANLSALNGEIEIETQKGLGTRFTLKVPLTLIISQALFVRCGKDTYALPLAFVEEIRRIRECEIEEVGGKLLTKVRDVVTEVVRLDQQLGLQPIEPVNGYYRLVIVNVAGRQVGILVEEVLHKDEIVIKNLGEYLRNVKLFPGATIAPDGSLILLIDVNRLIAGESIEKRPLMTSANAARIFAPGSMAVAFGEIPEEAIERETEEKVVVLADDSISVRKFVGRMLEKAGYRVKLASDGLEALEIVTQARCDLVVTDLEMPRTNGYELMAHLRQNKQTREIPIMVVTSRAGAKHKDKAIKQGAADFLVKPVQEEQFIAAVQNLIGPARGKPGKSTFAGAGR